MFQLLVGIAIVIATVFFLVLVVYLSRKRVKDLKEERKGLFEQYAENQGARFIEDDVFGLQDKIGSIAGISVAGNQLQNIVSQPEGELHIYLFDQLKIPRKSTGSQWGFFTICFVELKNSLGLDVVINEAENKRAANITRDMGGLISGMEFLTFDDNMFDDRFVVTTKQYDNAKKLLDNDMRNFLMDNAKKVPVPLSIQIKGNLIAVYSSALSAKSIETEKGLGVLADIVKGFLI